MPDKVLTVKEAANVLAVSAATVYRWAREGLLPRHKMGGSVRFTLEDLERFFKQSKEGE